MVQKFELYTKMVHGVDFGPQTKKRNDRTRLDQKRKISKILMDNQHRNIIQIYKNGVPYRSEEK